MINRLQSTIEQLTSIRCKESFLAECTEKLKKLSEREVLEELLKSDLE